MIVMKTSVNSIKIDNKEQMLSLMNQMVAFVQKYSNAELPKPTDSFVRAKSVLEKGEFNLLVCGKVKNGKSSLINALIGKDLLPVSDDVATSRVFKISNADKISCALVYANGEHQPIKEEELACYGSQTLIDEEGLVDTKNSIAYIEVNAPMPFLPEGISLIDSPGIGSNYPEHTEITKQFMQYADAAIYVMSPSVIEDAEVGFLNELTEITPNILFVMSKIDLISEEEASAFQNRNIEILSKKLKDRLFSTPQVWGVSSVVLKEATNETNSEIAEQTSLLSGYEEVKNAINDIIYQTEGLYRVGAAYTAALEYFNLIHKAISNRINTISESQQRYNELLQEYNKAKTDFENQYGSAHQAQLVSQIDNLLNAMSNDFHNIFASDGAIVKAFEEQIKEQKTEAALKVYAEDLGQRVATCAQDNWKKLVLDTQKSVSKILTDYDQACRIMMPPGIQHSFELTIENPTIKELTLRQQVSGARSEILLSGILTSSLYTVGGAACYFFPAAAAAISTVLSPVVIALGVGTLIWGLVKGTSTAKEKHVQASQTELLGFVRTTLKQYRSSLVETTLANGTQPSAYTRFVNEIKQQSSKGISDIYDKYYNELEAMKQTVIATRQNPQMLKATEQLLENWNSFETTLRQLHDILSQKAIG